MMKNYSRNGAGILVAILIFTSVALDAAPYPPGGRPSQWKQPDGTILEIRVFGDEFYARTETTDGRTLVFNEATLAYELAEVSENGEDLVSTGVRPETQAAQAAPNLGKIEKKGGIVESVKISPRKREALWRARRAKLFPNEDQVWQEKVQSSRARRLQKASGPQNAAGAGSGSAGQSPSVGASPANAVFGSQVGLTIPVQFPDDTTTVPIDPTNFPTTQAKIERYCNEVGYTDDGNTGSIRDYFADQSLNQVTYTQVVAPIVTLPNPRNWYNYDDHPTNLSLRDSGQAGRLIVQHAIEALKAQSFDFSGVTKNGTNQMIATNIIFAGADSGVWSEGLWPHRWVTTPYPGINAGTAGSPIYAYDYQITNAQTSSIPIGTFIHENGHLLLKFPDLYDYGGESEGVGNHALMAAGNHVDSGHTPAPINVYFKDVSGWANITDITASTYASVSLPSYGNVAYRIQKPGTSTEYFIVENRGAGDRWADHVPDKGLLIWHIDETVNGNNNEQMTPSQHYEVSLEQADGDFDLENNVNRGDSGDAFDQLSNRFDGNSIPDSNWWSGTASGITIKALSAAGANMNVQFNLPLNTIELYTQNGGVVFDGTPVNIDWAGNFTGNVKIELYKGGVLDSVIASSVANTGRYNWTPNVAGGSNYKIRVSSVDNGTIEDFSDVNFSVSSVIFSDDFETGSLSSEWAVTGTNNHRTVVTSANSPHSGSYHVTMDSSVDASLSRNELTLSLDLFGASGVELTFEAKDFNDEVHGPPTSPFVGGANFDGVAISVDGATWYEVQPLRTEISSSWQTFTVDLDAALAARGLFYTSTFKIRFNHYDDYSISTDGFAFDDVVVSGALLPPSETSLDLMTLSDSGVSNSDNVTNHNQPFFQGITDPGKSVTVNSSISGILGTAIADGSGVWTLQAASAMADGQHSVTANPAGGLPSDPLLVTIDTTAPSAPVALDLSASSDTGASNSDNITNDVTPDFSCTAVGSVSVLIKSNLSGTIGTGIAGAAITSSTLSEGTHQITATAFDLAGNESAASAPLAVTIDVTPPAGLGLPDLPPEQDTGRSNTDNITQQRNLTISGSNSQAGISVAVVLNGVVAGSTAGGGAWSIPLTNLADNTYTVKATQTDAAGNVSSSPVMVLKVDNVAPTPGTPVMATSSDTGSSSSDGVTNDTTPTISVPAEAGSSVVVTHNSLGIIANLQGALSFTTAPLSEGGHQIRAQETDEAGNVGAVSNPLVLTVDVTPPGVVSAPVLAAASDSGISNSDNITRLVNPAFVGLNSEANSTVTILADGGPIGTGPSAGGPWTVNTVLPEGNYAITASQTDLAGNVGTASAATNLVIDTTGPPAPTNLDLVASSDLGSSSTDNLTADVTPTISGNAEQNVIIKLFSDGAEVGSVLTDDATWEVTATPIGASPASDNKLRVMTATASDLAGNLSATSAGLTITIDNKPPTSYPLNFKLSNSSDTGASDTDRITSDNTPEFSGFGSIGELSIFADQTPYATFTTLGSWVHSTDEIPDGSYLMTARYVDMAGNKGLSSASIPLTIDTVAPAAPSDVGLVMEDDKGISNSDNITNVPLPTLTGNAEPGEIRIFQNTEDKGTVDVGPDGVWTYVPAVPLPEGQTQFTASQLDVAGNQGTSNNPLVVTIDFTPPAKPSVPVLAAASDHGPFNNDGITNDDSPVFTGTSEADTIVYLFDEGNNPVGSGPNDAPWVITEGLEDGIHQIKAKASDIAGNYSTETVNVSVTVDTMAPDVTVEQGAQQADPTVDHPIVFDILATEPIYGLENSGFVVTGAASSGATVALSVGDDGDSTYSAEVGGTSVEGSVTLAIGSGVATDLAGNPINASTSVDNTVTKKLLPNPISDLSATDDDYTDKVALTWSNQPEATVGYRVFRNSFNLTKSAEEIAVLPPGTTSFDDNNPLPGTWQFYWVRSEDEDGLSTFGDSDPGRTTFSLDPTKRAETPLDQAVSPVHNLVDEWDDADAGIYDGLIRSAADETTLIGSGSIILGKPKANSNAGGAFSGSVYYSGRKIGIKGVFDTLGQFSQDFKQRDGTILAVQLEIHETDSAVSEIIVGTVSHNGIEGVVNFPRAPFHAKLNPAPEAVAGPYTMVMPSLHGWGEDEPGGDGWATVAIATSGVVKIAGQLGDGTKLTDVGYLSAENDFCLYQELYRSVPSKGRIGGQLVVTDRPGQSDFDGILQWMKFADVREKIYAEGFDVAVWGLGSKFVPPAGNVRVFPELADQNYNAELTFVGPTAPMDLPGVDIAHRTVSWFANNQILHYGPEKLSASVSSKNGLLKGSFYAPATKTKIAFSGIAFQKQARTAGTFLSGGKTGALRIKPGTDWIYPGSEDPGVMISASDPGGVSAGPNLTPVAHSAGATGSYHGVLSQSGSFSGGIESLKYSPNGSVSGRIWLDGAVYSFKGIIDSASGTLITTVNRKGLQPVNLTLQLAMADGTADGYQFTGLVEIDGVFHDFDAQRNPHSKLEPSPYTGSYTLAIVAPTGADPAVTPAGDGYGTIAVVTTGTIKSAIVLADGTKATIAGHHSRNGQWSIHRQIYGKLAGFFAGNLTFRETVGVSDIDGEIRWLKPGGSKPSTIYSAGFESYNVVVGSAYTAPPKGACAFPGLADAEHNTWFRIESPDIDKVVTWAATNRILYYGPEKVSLKFNSQTGLLTGSYIDKPNGHSIKFGGVLLDDQGLISGHHITGGESHRILVSPRD